MPENCVNFWCTDQMPGKGSLKLLTSPSVFAILGVHCLALGGAFRSQSFSLTFTDMTKNLGLGQQIYFCIPKCQP